MSTAIATEPALLVVGHGTRDADGLAEFHALAALVRDAAGALRRWNATVPR